MLEAYLASLWKPTDERGFVSPSEKDKTRSVIDELQRELDTENSTIGLISKVLAEHRRRAQILEEELQRRREYIAPIRRVLDDILLDILDLARRGDPWQIWRFSHVCRHWRQLCHSCAWLWSPIEANIAVDRPFVGLVQKWRARAWRTKQTIVLRLYLEQFGALVGMLQGGRKYITHLRLTIPNARVAPPAFDLPPALPCLRHLALINDGAIYPLCFLAAKLSITSLCHRLFTRKQTRRTRSAALFDLEFRNVTFYKCPRVMNRVQTVVLRDCSFSGRSLIVQFLKAATSTLEHLEYTNCWTVSSESLPHTRPLTFPRLLTLKQITPTSTHQLSILQILSCPALTTLTVHGTEGMHCAAAQFPALKELCLIKPDWALGSHPHFPLLRNSTQLETLTLVEPLPRVSVSTSGTKQVVYPLTGANPETFTPSLGRIRVQVREIEEHFESGFWATANDFAERGRNIKFELIKECIELPMR
jgi:hypothetical protein